jgi:phage RecT family recombinase
MSRDLAPYQKAIETAKEKFVIAAGDVLRYDDESIFAMQALTKNEFALSTANRNPGSVQLAMRNVAATGLTLNPAHAYAYLVPRDGAIVLDISYKGLIKIATDSGAILWARADVVYAEDTFNYHGPAVIPEHHADVFKADRGALIGAYCIAKTRDGDVLTEVMPLAEIEKIRGKSDLFKKKASGPWVEWFVQMVKKAVIKRASKTWPYTGHSGKLFEAIELANAAEGGYTFEDTSHTITPTTGVWESINQERRLHIEHAAVVTHEYLDQDDLQGAIEYSERAGLDGAEENAAFWTLFKSYERAAMKLAIENRVEDGIAHLIRNREKQQRQAA